MTSTPTATARRSTRRQRTPATPVDRLEDRRLMSLTVALETPSGATSTVATSVGQVIDLNVVATVTSDDGTTNEDSLTSLQGSVLSAAVGTQAVGGDLAVTLAAGFDQTGSNAGTMQDLNADGHEDVGSNDTASNGTGDYIFALGSVQSTNGTVANGTLSFVVATATYTVTSLTGSAGQSTINFRPRPSAATGGLYYSAIWSESKGGAYYGSNDQDNTFRAGSPFHVYANGTTQATTGSVTTSAYADANGDATLDAGEAGLAGATMYVDLGHTGSYVSTDPSAQTDPTGAATIVGVPAGSYTLRMVPPTGYVQSSPASSGGTPVTVTAGGNTATANGVFGAEPLGSIAGTAYIDGNGNGIQDAGESTVPPAMTVVYLDVNRDGAYDTGDVATTTAADGSFLFSNVTPGTYALRVVVPVGDTVTQPAGDGSISVTVAPGAALAGQTFGLAPEGAINGTVYTDANGDGTQEAGEDGLAGVTVYLDENGNGADDAGEPATTTDGDGAFSFSAVPAGAYAVRAVAPSGDTLDGTGSATVDVYDGSTVGAGALGVVPPGVTPTPSPTPTPTPTPTPSPTPTATTGSITGTLTVGGTTPRGGATVYLDSNGNGLLDAGEATATTAADGTYTFANLTPGTYTVRELVPLGDRADPASPASYGLTVTAGSTASATDFSVAPLTASPLTVAFVAQPRATAIGGDVDTVRLRVANPSTATATFSGPVTAGVYLAVGGQVSTQDATVGAATHALRLRPGKSAVVTVKYTVPLALATASYDLVAAAAVSDPAVAPALATATTAVSVTAATVDLSPTVVAATAGVRLVAGRRAAVPVRLTNDGNYTATGTVTVTIYATTTGTVDATAVQVGVLTAHKVKVRPGKAAAVGVPITAPAALTVGSYQLVAVVTSSTAPADADAANDTSAAVATR